MDTTALPYARIEEARLAIWRLFEAGLVDEDMATAGLLAVDVGTRRSMRESRRPGNGRVAGRGSRKVRARAAA